MAREHERARALRRKARALHRRADAALGMRRVFDATKHRTEARNLEAQAAALEADIANEYTEPERRIRYTKAIRIMTTMLTFEEDA